ncbi:MAG: CSLREA domain-containing protein [Anaerolineae bacterium]
MPHRGFSTFSLAVLLAILFGAVFPVRPAYAASFTVNTTADTVDANPGNGSCAGSSGNCSLRAAIMETNALAGADTIFIPTGTYR